jgi:tetratricopeptide (TPR) repeat protein
MPKKRQKKSLKRKPKDMRISRYEVTWDQIEDPQFDSLPAHVQDTFEGLHTECREQPDKAIPELLEWIEKYPDIPMLYNCLSGAYDKTGQYEKSHKTIEENYQRNPDNLFARLNYAGVYLDKGDYEKVAEIFEYKFDLKLLYPKRDMFHISEVTYFMGIAGVYFFDIGEREAAQTYLDMLKQLAPEHPMTKILNKRLSSGLIRQLERRILQGMIRILQKLIDKLRGK